MSEIFFSNFVNFPRWSVPDSDLWRGLDFGEVRLEDEPLLCSTITEVERGNEALLSWAIPIAA